MSENPLVAGSPPQDTAFAVPPMLAGGPELRYAPRDTPLQAVPALAALPPMAPAPPGAPVEAGSALRTGRVPPPSSKAMSSPDRRLRATALEVVLFATTLAVGWLLWSAVTWRHGQTPAKRLMRMRCIDTREGTAAGFRTMAHREVGLKWLPGLLTLGLGLAVGGAVALGERREALWDKGAKTIVIDDPDGRYRPH